MTFTEQCFSFFGVVLVMAVLPLLILLVLKSEDKLAGYGQLKSAIDRERVVVGAEPTSASQNFKLVQTWGVVKTPEPLNDSLFGLTVGNALRLRRKVEMYQYSELALAKDVFDGSDEEELETTQIDQKFELKFDEKVIQTTTHNLNRRNPSCFPFRSYQ
jgi:hypothetical protein